MSLQSSKQAEQLPKRSVDITELWSAFSSQLAGITAGAAASRLSNRRKVTERSHSCPAPDSYPAGYSRAANCTLSVMVLSPLSTSPRWDMSRKCNSRFCGKMLTRRMHALLC